MDDKVIRIHVKTDGTFKTFPITPKMTTGGMVNYPTYILKEVYSVKRFLSKMIASSEERGLAWWIVHITSP